MNRKIAIVGAGSMGTAMAVLLSKNGNNVRLWSPMKEEVSMLEANREHITRLPGIKVPESVQFTTDLRYAAEGCEVVVLAVPSQTTRQNCKALAGIISKNTIVVTCSKGIEDGTCKLLSEIMQEELPDNNIAVLSGPSHAEEIPRDIPTTVVAASEKIEIAEYVQDLFMTSNFRVYTNTDVVGVELGGALKNIIALCAGISDGLGFGDNTKAALMTRGIAEISRLGVAMGGNADTFSGLTGVGDLIVTCTSMHSRNRRAGILIGQGKSVPQALEEVNMVVEGVATTKPAYDLAHKLGVSMPITEEAYKILFEGKDPRSAVGDLMTRDKKMEM